MTARDDQEFAERVADALANAFTDLADCESTHTSDDDGTLRLHLAERARRTPREPRPEWPGEIIAWSDQDPDGDWYEVSGAGDQDRAARASLGDSK